jgi:hypoxanthine phosphoribosyltransferase
MTEKELVITRSAIARRVKELGAAITRDYADTPLLVVGILNGAFMFMADLVREIRLDMEIDFVRAASYGMKTESGTLRLTKDIELELDGKHLLIVEDIIDTGQTMAQLKQLFSGRGVRSIRFCALIDKKERREIDTVIDYVGFEVKAGFLVGYGLDCGEHYRQLPEVYRLKNT